MTAVAMETAAGTRAHRSIQPRPAEEERPFAGQPLRWPGLPRPRSTSYVQKQLGHPSKVTRKYQLRRDRFRVNLTTAAGL